MLNVFSMNDDLTQECIHLFLDSFSHSDISLEINSYAHSIHENMSVASLSIIDIVFSVTSSVSETLTFFIQFFEKLKHHDVSNHQIIEYQNETQAVFLF